MAGKSTTSLRLVPGATSKKSKPVPGPVVDPRVTVVDAEFGGDGFDWGTVPAGLSGVGRDTWNHLKATFGNDPARFREGDRQIITSYCQACDVMQMALDVLKEDGMTVEGRNTSDRAGDRQVRSPAYGMWRDAAHQARMDSDRLLLNPAARRRAGISDVPNQGQDDNPFMPGGR